MRKKNGFTLIELAVVLIIVGLIVGGVVVGQTLITAATANAQITQINQFLLAKNTFFQKYGSLPGDITTYESGKFNFAVDTNGNGGNGDGVIENSYAGEANRFWVHLSETRMIPETISLAYFYGVNVSGTQIASYLPPAKIGGNAYVHVWSGGPDICSPAATCPGSDGKNYFSINDYTTYCHNWCVSQRSYSMKVSQAAAIDRKADDGLPQSGNVLAMYYAVTNTGLWAGNSWLGTGWHEAPGGAPTTAAGAGSATSCYDNGGVVGVMQYSISQNGGNNPNCALSFKF